MTPPADGEVRPGPERSRLSRLDVLHAAVALIDTEGVGRLTMRRLGAALGVEAMALYRYFPSRQVLLDALVESVVSEVATDPSSQMVPDDDWTDYLDRLAHGIRRMALTHPRVFPLVATHPTQAPWIRPPIRSLRWVNSFLEGLQDHHFPPPAAVSAYKQFSTFLLGHLLLEVAALGLEHPPGATAPPAPPDSDRRDADQLREARAAEADSVMAGTDAPDAEQILNAATSRPGTIADEPALQAADLTAATSTAADAVTADVDLPLTAVVVSTATIDLDDFSHVNALAGLLAQDTAAADFSRDLDRLLHEIAHLRRPLTAPPATEECRAEAATTSTDKPDSHQRYGAWPARPVEQSIVCSTQSASARVGPS